MVFIDVFDKPPVEVLLCSLLFCYVESLQGPFSATLPTRVMHRRMLTPGLSESGWRGTPAARLFKPSGKIRPKLDSGDFLVD